MDGGGDEVVFSDEEDDEQSYREKVRERIRKMTMMKIEVQ